MMDTSMSFVASKSGLDAAGGLLLLLNTAFVLIMVLLLAQAGVADIKKGLLWVHKHFKSCWACFASPARASLRGTKPPIPLSTQMESPGTSCSASRANSTTALTQAVITDSGDLMLVERLWGGQSCGQHRTGHAGDWVQLLGSQAFVRVANMAQPMWVFILQVDGCMGVTVVIKPKAW